jgi:hypothetical protein
MSTAYPVPDHYGHQELSPFNVPEGAWRIAQYEPS